MRLSTRVALLTGAALVVGGSVIGWSAALIARNESTSSVDDALLTAIDEVDVGADKDPFAIVEAAQRSPYPIAASIIFDDSPSIPLISQFSADGRSLMPALDPRSAIESDRKPVTTSTGSAVVRIASYSLGDGGWLVLSASIESAETRYRNTLAATLAASGAIAIVLAVFVYWLIGRQFSPLRAVVRTARAIAEGSFERSTTASTMPTEVRELHESLTVMVDELSAAMERRIASERYMREFLGETAHELRTPLTVIRGYVDILRHQNELDPTVTERALSRLDSESARMTRLLDDLLLLAELAETKQDEPQDVDLVAIVESNCDDLRLQEPGRRLTLSVPDDAVVQGDRTHAERLVANLFTNVRRHTPRDSAVAVTIARDATSIRFSIDDSGPGLTEEMLVQANRSPLRFASERNREANGSGLGLPIIKSIVHSFGGSIEFLPSALGGLRVAICFPRPVD